MFSPSGERTPAGSLWTRSGTAACACAAKPGGGGDMACGFSVHFRTAKSDPPESARVRVESVDLREFNSGLSCFGTLLRDGEYVLRKTKWRLVDPELHSQANPSAIAEGRYFFLPCAATASMAAFTFSGSPDSSF